MSFQHQILPDLLISELYKDIVLVNATDADQTESIPAAPKVHEPIKFLGNNQKQIAIIVKEPAEVFLPEKHLDFLSKILAACKLNIGDVAIVNQEYRSLDIQLIKQHLRPNQIILFGVNPTELRLPMEFPHFKLQNYDGCTYLAVPELNQLNSETEEGKLLKTKLWICLKSMFPGNGTT